MFSARQYGIRQTQHVQAMQAEFDHAPQGWRWTHHAQARVKQRGVQSPALQALLDWGTSYPCGGGGRDLLIFRNRDIDKLMQNLPKAERLAVEKQRRLFAVLGGDGAVVTVGHRTRRLRRH